jgi:amidophosphoribosyltransferase
LGLVRSHYVGRTFIEPQQSIRHFGVRLKLSPVEEVLRGKRVVVVDDSIVRGTTSRKIVKMLRDAGAREVHMRISSPPTKWPCYYGIDTPTRQELIAANHSVEEICEYITSDSLAYLSQDRMIQAVVSTPRRTHGQTPEQAIPAPGRDPANGQSRANDADEHRHLKLVSSEPGNADGFCHACFSGDYPIPAVKSVRSRQMRLLDL